MGANEHMDGHRVGRGRIGPSPSDPRSRVAPPGPRRVLVLGRRGRLAAALARAWWPVGWTVASRGREAFDLGDAASVERMVATVRPDVVVNVAGHSAVDAAEREPELADRLNHRGAASVAAAAERIGAALIHLSTDFVFDGRHDRPYRPADRMRPLSVYGATKAAGEDGVRAACRRHAIVRTAWLFDPQSRNFVTTVLALAVRQDRIDVVHDQTGSPTWTDDLAASLVMLAACLVADVPGAIGTHHCAGEGHVSRLGLAAAVLAAAAASDLPTARAFPARTAPAVIGAARRPPWSVLDTSDFRRLTGRGPRPWRDAVEAVVGAMGGGRSPDQARGPHVWHPVQPVPDPMEGPPR
jgi:dTDP-4-dehydrorhamnose reductase